MASMFGSKTGTGMRRALPQGTGGAGTTIGALDVRPQHQRSFGRRGRRTG